MKQKIKLLTVHDAPILETGFARVAQNLLKRWDAAGVEVHCWGIGYTGWGWPDKAPYVTRMYPGGDGGNWSTPERLSLLLTHLNSQDYTHLFIMQDSFCLTQAGPQSTNTNFPEKLRRVCSDRNIRSVYYFPVDAPLDKEWTRICAAVDVPVAYTQYGKRETEQAAARLDLDFQCETAAHGVDLAVYHDAADRAALRRDHYRPAWFFDGDFVMVNVNANQRRKDVGRSLEILRCLRDRGLPAKLLMHMPNLSGDGIDLQLIAGQLGFKHGREWGHSGVYFTEGRSVPEDQMHKFYAIADLYLSTSLGEGWGLPACEALACGTPIALPEHTACAEIMDGLAGRGMADRCVRLPVEKWRGVNSFDNSRLRPRVDVERAADAIEAFYRGGVWQTRVGINSLVMEWWHWDRIAAQFLRWFKGEMTAEKSYEVIGKPVISEPVISEPVRGVPGANGVTRSAPAETPVTELQRQALAKMTGAEPADACRHCSHCNRETRHEIFGGQLCCSECAEPPYDCIPVLGVPVLNRPDLLRRMIESIDYPVGKLVIIHNSHPTDIQVTAAVRGVLNELQRDWKEGKLPFIGEGSIQAIGNNLGVAASWNRIIEENPAPYWMLVGNDIQFTPGDLEKMHRETAARLSDHVILFANWGHSFFCLTQLGWDTVGSFDENIYPAYLEDCDHSRRLNLLGCRAHNVQEIHAIHGDDEKTGSSTIRSDAEMLRRNAITHANNFAYYRAKWGGKNGEEVFANPFNDPTRPVKEWKLLPDLRAAQLEARAW